MDMTRFDSEIEILLRRPIPMRGAHPMVLLYGSSTFTFWGHERSQHDLAPYIICNHGFGGSTSADALMHFDALVKPVPFDILALYEGDNDQVEGLTPDAVAHHTEKIIALARKIRPHAKVVLLGVKPSPSRVHLDAIRTSYNARLDAIAKQLHGVIYVSLDPIILGADGQPDPTLFLDDMLHLNERGYERLAQWLKAAFVQVQGD